MILLYEKAVTTLLTSIPGLKTVVWGEDLKSFLMTAKNIQYPAMLIERKPQEQILSKSYPVETEDGVTTFFQTVYDYVAKTYIKKEGFSIDLQTALRFFTYRNPYAKFTFATEDMEIGMRYSHGIFVEERDSNDEKGPQRISAFGWRSWIPVSDYNLPLYADKAKLIKEVRVYVNGELSIDKIDTAP
jgi:hypothetical protein